jgi:alpha-NAC-related protein
MVMFPGGRGMNPKQMKAAMKRQGIDMDSLDGVEKVVVLTRDKEIVFDRPEVTTISAQGTVTYQVVGSPKERPRSAATAGAEASGEDLVRPSRRPSTPRTTWNWSWARRARRRMMFGPPSTHATARSPRPS